MQPLPNPCYQHIPNRTLCPGFWWQIVPPCALSTNSWLLWKPRGYTFNTPLLGVRVVHWDFNKVRSRGCSNATHCSHCPQVTQAQRKPQSHSCSPPAAGCQAWLETSVAAGWFPLPATPLLSLCWPGAGCWKEGPAPHCCHYFWLLQAQGEPHSRCGLQGAAMWGAGFSQDSSGSMMGPPSSACSQVWRGHAGEVAGGQGVGAERRNLCTVTAVLSQSQLPTQLIPASPSCRGSWLLPNPRSAGDTCSGQQVLPFMCLLSA